DLARTDRLAGRPAESGEEISRTAAVGDLHGSGPHRQTGKLVLRLRYLSNAVEHGLRPDAANRPAGKVTGVALVGRRGLGRKLVGPRHADVLDQLLEVILV